MQKPYDVLAYYGFVQVNKPNAEIAAHKKFFEDRDVRCRIYISENGINGQMSAIREDALAYMDWMRSRSPFENIHFKVHPHYEQTFPRQTVKYRKQLVAIDTDVDLTEVGDHLSPKEWKEMLETEQEKVIIDVRNDYEWDVGHFDGAVLPNCNTFREFNDYADKLVESTPKDKPVMMYCTGGIRCEIYSSLLKKKGFETVYQLQGGVINYGLEEGNKHWKGKLFVFDDRLTIPISDEETDVIGKCHYCNAPTDNYYNCANMDCNTLFLCCSNCLKSASGCCQTRCKDEGYLRPFSELNAHKPFRKKHTYSSSKT